MKQPSRGAGRAYQMQRAAHLRKRYHRLEHGAITQLVRRTVERLGQPGSDGTWMQRELLGSVTLVPLLFICPPLRRWAGNTFRRRAKSQLPVYLLVFTDNPKWLEEFAEGVLADEALLRRIHRGPELAKLIIELLARAVPTSLCSREVGEVASQFAKRLVRVFAPDPQSRMASWMDFTEGVDAYLKRVHEEPFFGTDFLLEGFAA